MELVFVDIIGFGVAAISRLQAAHRIFLRKEKQTHILKYVPQSALEDVFLLLPKNPV